MKAVAVLLAAALPLAAAQPPPPPSEAERLLFLHEHLANVGEPRVLRYRYVEDAQAQERVTDRATMTLRTGAGGRCCDVEGTYLSGRGAVQLPDIPQARANPVLLYFLEGEVRRLQRTTQGQAAHFRRRMRQALVDEATIADTPVRWGDRTVPGRTVRMAPFLNDPYRGRFPEQAATEYAFVLSDAVPGGVYSMEAALPGGAARRTLTLEDPQP
ncbi:hypothetical protein H8N03_04600 [Ramlibacter sp. USB13]|uniref:DUF1571 domain-containing protein n=1 Tax=Ramlibacter cellulosilyticus TaxID=2764187 RepID=A0A923MN98_9BURK|nr:hypothetical protein [Ramlibacter cellulosilyticus]MBC5782213.1 hypothetical protein [Ramlibacter cellulosilyticus]